MVFIWISVQNLTTDYTGQKLVIGDRVVWSMTVGCGECFFCKKKLPQKCTKMFKYGHVKSDQQPHFTGGFAKYVQLKKGSYIFKVSPELTDEEVAPLMCAASTITSGLDYGDFHECDYVIIQGCGALGMYACAFTKQLGAKKIIAIDVMNDRLELAKQEISICSISGPVGTYNSIDPSVEKYVANKLNLSAEAQPLNDVWPPSWNLYTLGRSLSISKLLINPATNRKAKTLFIPTFIYFLNSPSNFTKFLSPPKKVPYKVEINDR